MNAPGITIRERVTEARRRLVAAGIPDVEAEIDARLLAQDAFHWDTARFFLESEQRTTPQFESAFATLIRRRERREPMAYIRGRQEFWGLDIEVTPDVLIPRPETELLIELAQELLDPSRRALLADIGTGSGCIAVALAKTFPLAHIIATDVSAAALAVARRNAERHAIGDRVRFVQTSLFDGVNEQFDFIAANPPYVARNVADTLPSEVRDFEPHGALFGGDDGLAVIRQLLQAVSSRLKIDAPFVFEFGFGQGQDVAALIADAPGVEMTGMKNDLQGIPRAAIVIRN